MKIFIGNDHGAVNLKKEIIKFLVDQGYEVINLGVDEEKSVDYPEYGKLVARKVLENEGALGIVMCGTGIGISIAANKVPGIRAALCTNEYMAEMARRHNNANILALGGRVIGPELAKNIVKAFLNASFEGGRHQRRIDMIE